ncbi:MAG: hypothetical protein M0033_09390 [Nitrospiraceae bacterium]|nr:hypothetical protein [Nitrospiraceae bacterium]
MNLHAILDILIFLATLAGIMARPFRIQEATASLAGAALMLLGIRESG